MFVLKPELGVGGNDIIFNNSFAKVLVGCVILSIERTHENIEFSKTFRYAHYLFDVITS